MKILLQILNNENINNLPHIKQRIQTFQHLILPIKDLTFKSKISSYLSAEVNDTLLLTFSDLQGEIIIS